MLKNARGNPLLHLALGELRNPPSIFISFKGRSVLHQEILRSVLLANKKTYLFEIWTVNRTCGQLLK